MEDIRTKKSIINRCALMKEIQQFGTTELRKLAKKHKVGHIFTTILFNKGIITKNGMRVIWNTQADPNTKMAEVLMEEERKYFLAHGRKPYAPKSMLDKALDMQIKSNSFISKGDMELITKSPTPEYNVRIRGNEVIINSEDFFNLIKK